MRQGHLLMLGAVMLAVAVAPAGAVLADVAPPQYAQGGNIDPHGASTRVEMVSEDVLLTVVDEPDPDPGAAGLAAGLMRAHVEARFVMRNTGDTQEAFDVWFPLSTPNGFGEINRVADFAARVNGTAVGMTEQEAPGQWDQMVSWATWPVTFPPGEDVVLQVTYTTWPTGYRPYGTFAYILETGAGWAGPIGAGTVTVRLPAAVTAENAALNPDGWDPPNPASYEISGTDVIWRFTDLEPTREYNIALTVLPPATWAEIEAARRDAALKPGARDAQLRLARALVAALSFKYGLNEIGNSRGLAAEADAAYLRAVTLAPEDVEVYVEYLDLLQNLSGPMGPVATNLVPVLERALDIAPQDERLLQIKAWVEQLPPDALTPAPTVPVVVTQAPAATATPRREATAAPALTPAPPPPIGTEVSTPAPTPATPAGGLCPGAIALPLGALVIAGSHRARRPPGHG